MKKYQPEDEPLYDHDEINVRHIEEDLTNYFSNQIGLALAKHFEGNEDLMWRLVREYDVKITKIKK